MFHLSPPMPMGGPERSFPRATSAGPVIVILLIVSQWQPDQAASLLGVLAMITVLSLVVGRAAHPRPRLA
ncbi:hypothetical protein ACFORH_43295 [Amycolatopsis roodepoortensis]|uniref:Amino acid permease n=1 Tax=Amycolatopsis roodepoortensis TaxID=700274 RepID=A0ABR9LIN4_9PSEU|nr:hypothetical protein [Amycolatopsis roodepoortensis]MBE1580432.1 hypothetical protein [Amycolatopsis roodepoortensis]